MAFILKSVSASCRRLDISPLDDLLNLTPPSRLPRAPLQIHMCSFVQAITQAGSDINESKLKNMSQDGMSGMSRTWCLYRRTRCARSPPTSDAQWRMRESTDVVGS